MRARRFTQARVALAEVPWPGGWATDALCHSGTVPTGMFFPARGDSLRLVKAACQTCPVLLECRLYALSHPGLKGVWGGMSERERRDLRQVMRRSDPDDVLNQEAG